MVQELDFHASSEYLPPQNVDAEESILGGILLDPDAVGRVADLLRPETFYLSAHQEKSWQNGFNWYLTRM